MSASVWNPGGQQQVPALPAVAPVSFVKGLIGNPGINFVGDTDTGIWSESDGYLDFVSNGITVLRIDPQGNITGNKFASGVELTIASAAVTDIGSLATNSVQVTGASTINSFGATYRGPMFVRFQSALQITYNATTLITPGAANISVVAGDSCIVTPKATAGVADGWVIVSYQSAAPLLNAVSSINGGQLAGLRNRIINGGMAVAQRGTSLAGIANNSFIADRFFLSDAAAGTFNYSQSTSSPSELIPYSANFGSVAGGGVYSIHQRIEDVHTLGGQTVTLSYYATCAAGTPICNTPRFVQSFGSGGSAAVQTFASNAATLTTSWQRFSHTVTLPTTVGKTIGAGSYLELDIYFPATTTGIFITGVQLEVGSVATPFEQRPYGMELALCQRYYQPVRKYHSTGANTAGQDASWIIPSMRVAPIIAWADAVANANRLTTSAGNNVAITAGGITSTVDSIVIQTATAAAYSWFEFYTNAVAEL